MGMHIVPNPKLNQQQHDIAWGLLIFGASLSLLAAMVALRAHVRRMQRSDGGPRSRTVMNQLILVLFGLDLVFSACMLAGPFVFEREGECQVTAVVTVAALTCFIIWNLFIAVYSLLLLRPAHDSWKKVLDVSRVNALLVVMAVAVVAHTMVLHRRGLLGHCMMVCWLHHPPEQFWYFYVPMGVAWLIITAIVIRLVVVLSRQSQASTAAAQAVRPLQRQAVAYSVSFIIVFIIPIINRITRLTSRHPPMPLFLIYSFSLSLRGFFDALVFGWLRRSSSSFTSQPRSSAADKLYGKRGRAAVDSSCAEDVLGVNGDGSPCRWFEGDVAEKDVMFIDCLQHSTTTSSSTSASSVSSSSLGSAAAARFIGLHIFTTTIACEDDASAISHLQQQLSTPPPPSPNDHLTNGQPAAYHTYVIGSQRRALPPAVRDAVWAALGGAKQYVMWHQEAAAPSPSSSSPSPASSPSSSPPPPSSVTIFIRASDIASGEVIRMQPGVVDSACASMTLRYWDTCVSVQCPPWGTVDAQAALSMDQMPLAAGEEGPTTTIDACMTVHHTLVLFHRLAGGGDVAREGEEARRWLRAQEDGHHHKKKAVPSSSPSLGWFSSVESAGQGWRGGMAAGGEGGEDLLLVHSLPDRTGQLRVRQASAGAPTAATLLLRALHVRRPLGLRCSLRLSNVTVRWAKQAEVEVERRGPEAATGAGAYLARLCPSSLQRLCPSAAAIAGQDLDLAVLFPIPAEDYAATTTSPMVQAADKTAAGTGAEVASCAGRSPGLHVQWYPASGAHHRGRLLHTTATVYPALGMHAVLHISQQEVGLGDRRSGQAVVSLSGLQDSMTGGWVDLTDVAVRSRGRVVGWLDVAVWLHLEVPEDPTAAMAVSSSRGEERKRTPEARWSSSVDGGGGWGRGGRSSSTRWQSYFSSGGWGGLASSEESTEAESRVGYLNSLSSAGEMKVQGDEEQPER